MATYSTQFKRELVHRVLTHKHLSVDDIARECEVPRSSLFRWMKEYGPEVSGIQKRRIKPSDWTYGAKLKAVLETQYMNEVDLGRYLRRNGLYFANLMEWKEEILGESRKPKNNKLEPNGEALLRRVRELEKELKIKDKALREATALLELKKKAQELWPEPGAESSVSESENELKNSSKKPKKTDAE